MSMRRLCIVSEDTYGYDYLREVIKRLLDEARKKDIKRDIQIVSSGSSKNKYKPCNAKIGRIVKVLYQKCDIILVSQDADGDNTDEVISLLIKHIQCEKCMDKIKFLIFKTEAEEWIVQSMNGIGDPKPSKYLKSKFDYDKRELPQHVNELNFSLLCRSSDSFHELVTALGIEEFCKPVH